MKMEIGKIKTEKMRINIVKIKTLIGESWVINDAKCIRHIVEVV
jgi:hypothetical protein